MRRSTASPTAHSTGAASGAGVCWGQRTGGRGAMDDAKQGRDERERLTALHRLSAAIERVRADIGSVRADTNRLAALEYLRRLTPDEASAARRLRHESERLSLELANLRAEFEWLRSRQL